MTTSLPGILLVLNVAAGVAEVCRGHYGNAIVCFLIVFTLTLMIVGEEQA